MYESALATARIVSTRLKLHRLCRGTCRSNREHRKQDFVRTLCRKFLGYALGRSVVLSDQPLLNEMEAALAKNDYRFSVLFEMVVRSPQFRQQRGSDFVAK